MELLIKWLDLLLVLFLLLGVGLYLHARAGKRARLLERTKTEVQRHGKGAAASKVNLSSASTSFMGILRKVGASVPLFSAGQRAEASSKLVSAGYRSVQALFVLIGISLLSIVSVMAIVIFYAKSRLDDGGLSLWLIAILASAYIGSLFPRLVLDYLVKRRQEAIRLALPDALDLLVITTNAGLALNAAIDRVANELVVVAPELADELKLTSIQLRVSSDVEGVLNGLAERTNLDGMRTLVNTFVQARQYGTAITKALRILARSERTARMMRLEEQAAKLAVKMTVPMMLFILPTVLIVGAGPAILGLMKTLSGM